MVANTGLRRPLLLRNVAWNTSALHSNRSTPINQHVDHVDREVDDDIDAGDYDQCTLPLALCSLAFTTRPAHTTTHWQPDEPAYPPTRRPPTKLANEMRAAQQSWKPPSLIPAAMRDNRWSNSSRDGSRSVCRPAGNLRRSMLHAARPSVLSPRQGVGLHLLDHGDQQDAQGCQD